MTHRRFRRLCSKSPPIVTPALSSSATARVHLFHSVHPEWVGTRLVGGDNQAVLEGKSITTIRKGGLGVSLRSKTPIVDDEGRVIGIVSVGYLTSYLDSITLTKVINIFIAAVLLLIALFIFSWYFTRSIKKQIFRSSRGR